MKKLDWIIIGSVLIIAVGILLIRSLGKRAGDMAVVTLNGTVILEQTLSEEAVIPIRTEEGYNILQIADGGAKIIEADCRDLICVNHIKVSKKGESIVCLPHQLVVEIVER